MPRYVVERSFPDGLRIPVTPEGAEALRGVVTNNDEHGATWVTSFVSSDATRTYCVYDAPSPEAVRQAATTNGLPADQITEVRVLDPYFYLG
ncbi:MAG: DUF4242 domain-containing protein [Actinomycetota bacterium]